MNNFSFSTDEETRSIFNIVVWCLKRYFNHTKESAIDSINSYYHKNQTRLNQSGWGDDFYHYERPFRVAAIIQYYEVLKLVDDESADFSNWLRESGHHHTPYEAINYFNRNYCREDDGVMIVRNRIIFPDDE